MRFQFFAGQVNKRQTGGEIYLAELMLFLARNNEIVDESAISEVNRGSVFYSNFWCIRETLKYRADIIVENPDYAKCFLINNLLAKIQGSRIVVFLQAIPEDNSTLSRRGRILNKITMTLFLKTADMIIANSYYTQREAILKYSVNKNKIIVVSPSGQYVPSVMPKVLKGLKKIICVANIRPEKGQKYLVEAMHLLGRKDCNLTFIGGIKSQKYYEEIIRLVSDYGLQDTVNFAGFLSKNELSSEYQKADILAHPSMGEGYCMAIAEALGYGLPVVASKVGAIPEIIEDGKTGILVPPGKPDELAKALQRLIVDGVLCEKMSSEAFKKSRELPSWDKVCEKINSVMIQMR